jgi:enamine deaminase RidA (YjgF/YER057c/UK114 family)
MLLLPSGSKINVPGDCIREGAVRKILIFVVELALHVIVWAQGSRLNEQRGSLDAIMSNRQNISSGTIWESIAGYSRAVRLGNVIHVSGTTATDDDGHLVGDNDPYAQTVFIIKKIEHALNQGGASLTDVVRTRIYITDATLWEPVSRAHGEFFREIRPANTLIAVAALIGDGYLVEMEVEAIIQAS